MVHGTAVRIVEEDEKGGPTDADHISLQPGELAREKAGMMAVHAKHRVVIAGGGFAALEAVLGIRRLAGERVRIDLVSAERELTYRPLAVIEPFGLGEAPRFDLAEIAADQGVSLHIDAVRSVEPERRFVRTGSGTELRTTRW